MIFSSPVMIYFNFVMLKLKLFHLTAIFTLVVMPRNIFLFMVYLRVSINDFAMEVSITWFVIWHPSVSLTQTYENIDG